MKAVADLLGWRRKAASRAASAPDRREITQMFRNARQLQVVARLLRAARRPSLRVAVYGVADGAEAVSLLITIDPAASPIDLRIEGYDINPEYLGFAAALAFPASHFAPGHPAAAYSAYLERVDADWRLRPEWRPLITCEYGDVLSLTPMPAASYDAVLCQNLIVSLSPDAAERAMHGLAALVRPDGLLVVGGGPLDRIPALAGAEGFSPILDDVEAIHEGWTVQRRFYENGKPPYWALEPFDAAHPDGPSRYATIFRKRA